MTVVYIYAQRDAARMALVRPMRVSTRNGGQYGVVNFDGTGGRGTKKNS